MFNFPYKFQSFNVFSKPEKTETQLQLKSCWRAEENNLIQSHFFAGCAAGLVQSFIASPSERLKLLLQIQQDTTQTKFRSPWHAAKKLVQTQGYGTLSRLGFILFKTLFYNQTIIFITEFKLKLLTKKTIEKVIYSHKDIMIFRPVFKRLLSK